MRKYIFLFSLQWPLKKYVFDTKKIHVHCDEIRPWSLFLTQLLKHIFEGLLKDIPGRFFCQRSLPRENFEKKQFLYQKGVKIRAFNGTSVLYLIKLGESQMIQGCNVEEWLNILILQKNYSFRIVYKREAKQFTTVCIYVYGSL